MTNNTKISNNADWQSIGIGILVIVLVSIVFWGLFHEIGQAPWQFITVLGALLGALLGAVITFAGNLQIQIRNEQKPKKTEIYDKLIRLFFDFLLAQKLGRKPKTEEELIQTFADITPNLILWASDDVLRLYEEFQQMASSKTQYPSKNSIFTFGQILIAIRKDLGHQNKKIDERLILGTFINDIEKLDL
jgi:hypothetical protein